MTWLYRSTVANSGTSTVPGLQTRPRSLRARSTSMTCSARSFGSASSSAASAASSSGVAPRQRVPAIGCSSARRRPVDLDVHLRRGADDVEAVEAQQVHVRARVGGAQHPVDVERVGVGRPLEALRHHDLEALAGPDRLLGRLDRLRVAARPGYG